MEDPEADQEEAPVTKVKYMNGNVEMLGLKIKRSVSITSTTSVTDNRQLDLHQVTSYLPMVGKIDMLCADSKGGQPGGTGHCC